MHPISKYLVDNNVFYVRLYTDKRVGYRQIKWWLCHRLENIDRDTLRQRLKEMYGDRLTLVHIPKSSGDIVLHVKNE